VAALRRFTPGLDAGLDVCVPVYNAADFLHETIDSILSQDFTDFRLLLSVDASDDGSLAICRSYAHDARVSVFEHRQHLGFAGNSNFLSTSRTLCPAVTARRSRTVSSTAKISVSSLPGCSSMGSGSEADAPPMTITNHPARNKPCQRRTLRCGLSAPTLHVALLPVAIIRSLRVEAPR
jgi:hypothetical protein